MINVLSTVTVDECWHELLCRLWYFHQPIFFCRWKYVYCLFYFYYL